MSIIRATQLKAAMRAAPIVNANAMSTTYRYEPMPATWASVPIGAGDRARDRVESWKPRNSV